MVVKVGYTIMYMPRRNRTPSLQRMQANSGDARTSKTRYATRQAAENAIRESRKYNIDVELYTYQSLEDGGWYLTSKPPRAPSA